MNQENVVKVGHRQVVNMIRQGGNRLLIKVVTVSRNLDPEDTARKKGTAAVGHSCSNTLSLQGEPELTKQNQLSIKLEFHRSHMISCF